MFKYMTDVKSNYGVPVKPNLFNQLTLMLMARSNRKAVPAPKFKVYPTSSDEALYPQRLRKPKK